MARKSSRHSGLNQEVNMDSETPNFMMGDAAEYRTTYSRIVEHPYWDQAPSFPGTDELIKSELFNQNITKMIPKGSSIHANETASIPVGFLSAEFEKAEALELKDDMLFIDVDKSISLDYWHSKVIEWITKAPERLRNDLAEIVMGRFFPLQKRGSVFMAFVLLETKKGYFSPHLQDVFTNNPQNLSQRCIAAYPGQASARDAGLLEFNFEVGSETQVMICKNPIGKLSKVDTGLFSAVCESRILIDDKVEFKEAAFTYFCTNVHMK